MGSSFDDFIDSACFGQAKAKTGPALGLYLSPETIYIAETKKKDGKLVVEHLVRIPVPQEGKAAGGTMTMSTDFLADPTKIGGLIRQSMSQIRWGTKDVVVTLSHHLGLLRFFPMPPIDRRFLKSAVPLEAKKYIPIPFDALAYDYQAAAMPPDAAGKPRQGVLISVTQKKNLENIAGLMKTLGLNQIGLEVAPCSVLRLWQTVDAPKGPEPYVQVHFDGGNVRIAICDRGLPVFFREVFLGTEATLADQRKVDLTGCLGFAQKQLGLSGVSRIKLSGTPAALGPWKDALSQETGLPSEIQDTAKLLSIKGGDWGGYASIGASARGIAPGSVTLDLFTLERVSDEERQTARDIIVAGGVTAAVVAALGAFNTFSYNYRARELQKYNVDPDVKAALSNLPPTEIETKLKGMSDQLDRVKSIAGAPRPKVSQVIHDVVELMPDNIWVNKVLVQNPLVTDKGGMEVTFDGRARGATVSDEQDLAFQFKDTLLKSEKIGKNFDVQLSLSGAGAGAQMGEAGMDPKALASKLENRTQFIMILKAKRF